ncbi:MAG: methyltransferase domain-containing protein [Blastocatellia bacterium]|nr:methyltransferase domain-containing protein [Blastocatellia bacterium]
MFKERSRELERIDTGDYTPEEYAVFLREIAFINKYLGDRRALKRSLFRAVEDACVREFSVLDVGSGSGEMLRFTADFARRTGRRARLVGLDLNEMSAAMTARASSGFEEISSVRGDAFRLPFADGAFDYAISSLFFHHLTDEQIPAAFAEMKRVSRRGVFVIDLHRHPAAYALYKLFCFAFRISPLVRHDGALSILKGFTPQELVDFGGVERSFPFRLVIKA